MDPEQRERLQQIRALKSFGYDLEVDQEHGLIYIKQFTDCACCYGNVNMCSGVQCEMMGMCVCIYVDIQDKEYERDMKLKAQKA